MIPPDPQRPPVVVRRTNEEETELVRRAQAGDRAAFGRLVERYAGQARRLCRAVLRDPDDADDAAQDAFLSAWVKLGQFDPGRPLGPWLLRITANSARDRRRRRTVRQTETLAESMPSEGRLPDAEMDRMLLGTRLRAALDDLPVRGRAAVVLFDVLGYSHAEIAGILGVPEGTVRSDVHHARRRLRQLLANWKEKDA